MKYQNENFNGVLDYRSNFHQDWLVEMHLHEYSEILYCKSGEGLVNVNGQQLTLKKKTVRMVAPKLCPPVCF